MANTLLTNQIITYEALDVLENTCSAMQIVNGEYSSKFEFGGAVLGQTLDVRKPPRYLGRLGQVAQVEAITETSVPVTLAYQRGVDSEVSSQQLVLDIDDYRDRIVKPQVARLNNLIDQDVCGLAQGLNTAVGTPGVTPTSLTTYGLAKVALDNMAAPADERNNILNPIADFSLMDNLKGLFHTGREISAQYDSGSMTKSGTLGAKWSMDQNIFVHIVGALGVSTPIINGAPVSGATTIVTSGWQSGLSTVNAGDKFSFISTTTPVNGINPESFQSTGSPMQFVVTATTSDTTGAMTIPFAPAIIGPGSNQQNVTNLPANSTPLFFWGVAAANFATIAGKQTPQNLVCHKDFGTLAMVDLPLPGGTDKAYRAASKKSGKALRVIRDYVSLSDQWLQRLDVLYAVAVLRQELGVVVAG